MNLAHLYSLHGTVNTQTPPFTAGFVMSAVFHIIKSVDKALHMPTVCKQLSSIHYQLYEAQRKLSHPGNETLVARGSPTLLGVRDLVQQI